MDSLIANGLTLITYDLSHATAASTALAILLGVLPGVFTLLIVWYTITSFFNVFTSNRDFGRWAGTLILGLFILQIVFGGIFIRAKSGGPIENIYFYSTSAKEMDSGVISATSNVSVFGNTPFESYALTNTEEELAFADSNLASTMFISGGSATTPMYQISASQKAFPMLNSQLAAINRRLAETPLLGKIFIYLWNSLNTVVNSAGYIAESDNIKSSFITEAQNILQSIGQAPTFPDKLETFFAVIDRGYQEDAGSMTFAALTADVPSKTRATLARDTDPAAALAFYFKGLTQNQHSSLLSSEITVDNLKNHAIPEPTSATDHFQNAYVKETVLNKACLSPVNDDSEQLITADRIRLSEENATYGNLPDSTLNSLFLNIFGQYDTELVQYVEDLANGAPESPFKTSSLNPVGKNPTIASLLETFETDETSLKPCMDYARDYYDSLLQVQEQALQNIQTIDEYQDQHESVLAYSDSDDIFAVSSDLSGPGSGTSGDTSDQNLASLGSALRSLLKPMADSAVFQTEVSTNRAATNGTEKALEEHTLSNTASTQSKMTSIVKGVATTGAAGAAVTGVAALGAPVTAVVGFIFALLSMIPAGIVFMAYIVTYAMAIAVSAFAIIYVPFYLLFQFGKSVTTPATQSNLGQQHGVTELLMTFTIPIIVTLEMINLAVSKGMFMEFFNHLIGMLGIIGVTLGSSIVYSAISVPVDQGVLLSAMAASLKPLGINIGMSLLAISFAQVIRGKLQGNQAVSKGDVEGAAHKVAEASLVRGLVNPIASSVGKHKWATSKATHNTASAAKDVNPL